MSFEAQKQIRENTMELQEFLKDLKQWESRVKVKDKELKTKQHDHISDKPPVRGQRQTVAQEGIKPDQLERSIKAMSEEPIKEASTKTAATHTYDYFRDKWDKFDVEAALKEVDKDDMPVSQSNGRLINPKEMEATPAVKSRVTSDLPAMDFKSSLSKAFSDASEEKDLGNKYFKEKKFVQAIDCYSRSIALQPSSIAYANRAMAYIKIRKYKDAESDCTEAIELDDHYVKAYSRRSTARKELGNYIGALEDAEFALRLDPENKELIEQYKTAKEVCNKTMDMKNLERRHAVPIQEIKSEETNHVEQKILTDNLDNKVPSLKVASVVSRLQSPAQQLAEKNLVSVQAVVEQATAARVAVNAMVEAPRTFYEFEASWKSFSNNLVQQAEILKVLNPSSLPSLFKDNLSSKLLVEIIYCLKHLFPDCGNHAIAILENLTKARRFNLTVMCIVGKDKLELGELWDNVFLGAQLDTERLVVLKELKSKYRL